MSDLLSLLPAPAVAILGKGSLLLLGALVLTRVLPRQSASGRHLLWLAATCGIVCLPWLSQLLPTIPLPLLPAVAPTTVNEIPASGVSSPEINSTGITSTQTSTSTAPPVGSTRAFDSQPATARSLGEPSLAVTMWATVWALVSLILLARIGLGRLRTRRLAAEASELQSSQHRHDFASMLQHLSASRPVRVLCHEAAISPCTWGWRRPIVLLPADADAWSSTRLRVVLAHELAHIERRDWLVQQLAQLACAIYWFQPLMWLAARRLSQEAEHACDDRVLQLGASPPDYADQLLAFARRQQDRQQSRQQLSPFTVLTMARSHGLCQRIQSILDPRSRRQEMNRSHVLTVSLVTLALLLLLSPSTLVQAHAAGPADSSLMRAIDAGDLATTESLLASGADPNARQAGKGTPLIRAALAGDAAVVRELLNRGADPNRHETDGPRSLPRSALTAAAGAGHLEIVDLLIEAGAKVTAAPRGDASALMAAASGGHGQVVALLLQAGAKANRVIRGDGTPLIRAAARGHREVVEMLLEAGADPNRGVRGDGNPMIAASRGGHQEVVSLLLAHGARDTAVRGDGNALIQAAGRGDIELTRTLLDAGADVNGAVRGDGSPLISAARGGHATVVSLLIEHGADVDLVVPGDENALIGASGRGQHEVVQLLIDHGADVNKRVRADRGEIRTPLKMARRGGHSDVEVLLLSQGATD